MGFGLVAVFGLLLRINYFHFPGVSRAIMQEKLDDEVRQEGKMSFP